jgi:hypothetical protein
MARSSRRTDDCNQTRIDFDRERRERRQLVEAISHDRTGLTRRRWSNIQRVLVYLVNCDRGQGYFPYIASIAESCQLSSRTVDRAIADAKTLGVLSAQIQRNKSGRGSNVWEIHWRTLAALGVAKVGVNPRQDGVNQRQVVVDRRQNGVNPYKDISVSYTSANASSTSAATSSLTMTPAREEEVARLARWLREKLTHPPIQLEEAILTPLQNDVPYGELVVRCNWFVEHQRLWQNERRRAGAFFRGLERATPGLAPHKGWPTPERA